jgi:hypothetical protein
MQQAQAYLGGELKKIGASGVHTQSVPVFAWRDAPSIVEIRSPTKWSVESFHNVHSAAGRIKAPVLNAAIAGQDDLDRLGRRIEGAIVLVHGNVISGSLYLPLPQRLEHIAERGAAAIITASMDPLGCPAIELVGIKQDLPIPAFGVSHEDGRRLASLCGDGAKVTATVEAAGKSYRGKCLNLVAEMGPKRASEEDIVLSAHVDCFHVNPGAFDNLTGVVTLMEIARALAPLRAKFRRRLRLIVFTGEEYAFWGSNGYVRNNPRELERIRFVFNMDSLFDATAEGVAVMWSPGMRDYIERVFRETQCDVEVRNLFCMSSDYLPFMLEGIPAARPAHFDLHQKFPPYSHTRLDTPEKIPIDWIRKNAMVFAQMLLAMLVDPRALPAKRHSPDEVSALIEQAGARNLLAGLGFDRS